MELGCAVLTVDGQTSLKGNEQSEQVSKEQRAVCVVGRAVCVSVCGGACGECVCV